MPNQLDVKILQGIDIQSIARFEKSAEEHGEAFLNRIFTPHERGYCEPKRMKYEHYAVRFAAKEAVMKALGVNAENPISFQDIEVDNEASGRPFLRISEEVRKKFSLSERVKFDISLSHEREYAVASVLFAFPVQGDKTCPKN